MFKLNVALFPDFFNVYDSLGEAYMVAGEKELAIKNYKKSLELNPNNADAAEILKKTKERK
ncbi:tetratricopeptide repeat protein [candidate division WOR-3 bacterium]|nr:tetratricopeptide repeat protein [candidate division WOR-3 bacterium]